MGSRDFNGMATSMLHCGKKAVRVVSFSGLPPQINFPCILKQRKTGLVREYHLLPLFCRPALVISTPLQPLLNVDSVKHRFGGSSLISGFIELTANSFGRNWAIQMLIQLKICINKIIIVLHYKNCSECRAFSATHNQHLFSKARCTRPTISGLSDASPAATAILTIKFSSG